MKHRDNISQVVSYFNSTSNHNYWGISAYSAPVVSYFNSTSNHNSEFSSSSASQVVSYFNSTSNHNVIILDGRAIELFLISILHQTTTPAGDCHPEVQLFLISILHQTTTMEEFKVKEFALFLISILHQTTTRKVNNIFSCCCFLFQFYIKPQPRICDLLIVIRLCGRMNGTNGAWQSGEAGMMQVLYFKDTFR